MLRNPEMHFGLGRFHSASGDGLSNYRDDATCRQAVPSRFPNDWRELARQAGVGLRKLLDSPNDLEEARHTCEFGLLASQPPTADQLRIVGQRLLLDAIEPLEEEATR